MSGTKLERDTMSQVGDAFQQDTKYRPDRMGDAEARRGPRPEPYKIYPDRAKIVLPSPEPDAQITLHDAIRRRKSVRDFQPRPVSLGQLSYLLWASTGLQRAEQGYEFRSAPSAGALYPIETYIVAHRVGELEPGAYHYGVRNHELERVRAGDLRRRTATAALDQSACAEAAAAFIWTAIFARCTWKYGQRAYRYIYLDAGHIAQNLALAAVSLDLGTCQIGALFDDEVNKLLDLDGVEESVVYMSVVGVPVNA